MAERAHPGGRAEHAAEQARHAEIDVERFPVQRLAAGHDLDPCQIIGWGVREPLDEAHRDHESGPVSELDDEPGGRRVEACRPGPRLARRRPARIARVISRSNSASLGITASPSVRRIVGMAELIPIRNRDTYL